MIVFAAVSVPAVMLAAGLWFAHRDDAYKAVRGNEWHRASDALAKPYIGQVR